MKKLKLVFKILGVVIAVLLLALVAFIITLIQITIKTRLLHR